MKKTGATIFTLAMTLILVSSLGSGVILAKGPSDHASDQGKERARYQKVRYVAILDCGFPGNPVDLLVIGFHTNAPDVPVIMNGDVCHEAIASLLNSGLKMQDGSAGFSDMFLNLFSRYTFVKTSRERRATGPQNEGGEE